MKACMIQLNQEEANRILLALELSQQKVMGPEPATIRSKDLTECIRAGRLADRIFDAGLDAGFGQKEVVKEWGAVKVTRKLFTDDETHGSDGHAIG